MKAKVVWIGDGGVSTGFARVNHSIQNHLPDEYKIHHLAVNYRGDPYPDAKFPMYPAMTGGDILGIGRVKSLLEFVKPDLVFILNDAWVIPQYLRQIPEDVKVVTYFPVDAGPLKREWCTTLVGRTTPVAYTEFGRNAILKEVPTAKISIIPHGIDRSVFYPIDQDVARAAMNGINLEDFILLNANRNQPRKRIDLTIKAFAKFAKDKPKNVKLYLHMGVEDSGWHVIDMCMRYGVDDRLLLTNLELSPINSVSDERLNIIYNSCDVGINSSTGEGWGLTSFEHAACQKAQIVPRSSAGIEIYDGRGRFIEIDHTYTNPKILTEGAVISIDSMADAMNYYYENKDARKKDAKAIYDYIVQPKFDWANIALQWHELFMSIIDSKGTTPLEQLPG